MKIAEYQLPVHWLPSLINGDDDGLTDEDASAMHRFIDHNLKYHPVFHCLGQKDENDVQFLRYHDVHEYGVLACDVTTVLFDVGA